MSQIHEVATCQKPVGDTIVTVWTMTRSTECTCISDSIFCSVSSYWNSLPLFPPLVRYQTEDDRQAQRRGVQVLLTTKCVSTTTAR